MIKIIMHKPASVYFCLILIENMENIRHIHEVLDLLFNAGQTYTIDELYTTLRTTYGADVHFANCADNIFPIQEVVPFLLSKNKIRLEESTIIPLTPTCSH
ncbi:MAG: YecH family protein [Cytophagales bacterium]|nr:YecH family protein [Cytophagales bacterium]